MPDPNGKALLNMGPMDRTMHDVESRVSTGITRPCFLQGGTAVPDWAYQDSIASTQSLITSDPSLILPQETNAFNLTLASIVATTDKSESSSSASLSSTSLPTSTPTPSSDSSSSPNHTAAIVGGLIGGLIGVALLAVWALFWIRRRNRSRIAPSAAYLDSREHAEGAARGRYSHVLSKNERGIPYLPYSILDTSEEGSSLLFDPYASSESRES
ncbi:hypothetical protein D9757_003669 [Collybiopsis confluens]|uniref:Uncharacterized protein n=1 Tax=Collybiopsis confluens TaxID=2823264 RepID=A0A8H5MDL7_9AGAR|nr:hypothetical protein D9757_003669 [Collybiopsis confluens]